VQTEEETERKGIQTSPTAKKYKIKKRVSDAGADAQSKAKYANEVPTPSPTINVHKITTLNINGLHTRYRVEVLRELLWDQDVDILFLQFTPTYLTYRDM